MKGAKKNDENKIHKKTFLNEKKVTTQEAMIIESNITPLLFMKTSMIEKNKK